MKTLRFYLTCAAVLYVCIRLELRERWLRAT